MFTEEQLDQLRGVIREEVKAQLDPVEKRLSDKIAAVERKLDSVQMDIATYLNELEPRTTKLDHRVDRLEEHVELPKP